MKTLCGLFGKTRQAWYKAQKAREHKGFEAHILLDEVRKIRHALPRCGTEKLHFLLQKNEVYAKWNIKIGRDALADLLRQEGLLIKKKKNRARTTNSKHPYRKHPNTAKNIDVKRPNQVWVSDITYVPAGRWFSYLSLITDAHSRKIVGWHLSESLSADGCLKALDMAIASNKGKLNGLVHHSDRGCQYCSNAYVEKLQKNGIKISMTENGDPYENALAERMNRTIKEEMLRGLGFGKHQKAVPAIEAAIKAYNQKRPHASLDYYTPSVVHRHGLTGLKKRWRPKKYAMEKFKKEKTTTNTNAAESGVILAKVPTNFHSFSPFNCQPISV